MAGVSARSYFNGLMVSLTMELRSTELYLAAILLVCISCLILAVFQALQCSNWLAIFGSNAHFQFRVVSAAHSIRFISGSIKRGHFLLSKAILAIVFNVDASLDEWHNFLHLGFLKYIQHSWPTRIWCRKLSSVLHK